MAYGLLLLRLVVGLTLAGHGAQKLFGWFEGPGPRGAGGFFGSMRLRMPLAMAVLAGLCEFGGGLLLALGLLTPLAALAVAIVMLNAIGLVHWRNGFWATGGGYEYNLLIATVAVALTATGPGRFSLDAAIGWADNLSGVPWALGVLVAALLVTAATLTVGRERPEPVAEPAGATVHRHPRAA